MIRETLSWKEIMNALDMGLEAMSLKKKKEKLLFIKGFLAALNVSKQITDSECNTLLKHYRKILKEE